MACYAGLILLLLVCPLSFCDATGNIGCLFSESLCDQEKEWCFDDFAFGKCLPLYGRLHEENMFRYELRAEELHALEQEMQRLFLLGYRWSHTYTQCILQLLLTSIRDRIEPDVNLCNAELDQDLEGALRAIEGDEIESIDPQNLAIVRFRPSVVDPHSDYADELYYPAGKQVLPPYRPIDFKAQESTPNRDNAPTGNPQYAETEDEDSRNDSSKDKWTKIIFDAKPSQSLPSISEKEWPEVFSAPIKPQYNDEYPMELDDYDIEAVENLPYDWSSMVSIGPQKRNNRGNLERPTTDLSMSTIFRKLLRRNPLPERNLNEIAKLLNNIRHGAHDDLETRTHVTGEPMYYPSEPRKSQTYDYEDNRFDLPKETFGKQVTTKSVYNESPGRMSNQVNQVPGYNPYLNTNINKLETIKEPQLPELEPPKQETMYISDHIHPRYEAPPDDPESTEKDIGNIIEKPSKTYLDMGISRFSDNGDPLPVQDPPAPTKIEGHNRWDMSSVPMQESPYNPSMDYDNGFAASYGDAPYAVPPPDYPLYVYYPPFYNYDYYDYDYNDRSGQLQKNVKKDDEVPDYGNFPINGNVAERYDEKKPGPPFKQYPRSEDYQDMIQEPEYLHGGGDWMMPMARWVQRDRFYPMMRPGAPFYEQNEENVMEGHMSNSDPVHMDEAILDKAIDTSHVENSQTEVLPTPSKHISSASLVKDDSLQDNTPVESYVYITINREFQNEHDAKQLVDMILHYAGIRQTPIQHISIKKNLVAFKLPENEQRITPAELAEKIEELRPKILEKTHIEITQSGIGTKNALSGVVYQANDRQMEAAAAIVCGVCGALLVSATVLYLIRRQSKSSAKLQGITSHDTEASKDYQDLCRARMATKDGKENSNATSGGTQGSHVAAQRLCSLTKEPDNGNNSPSSRSSTSSWYEEPVISNMDISTGHMVLSYMEDHLRNKDRLDQEWSDLCAYEAEPSSTNLGLSEENEKKNRYRDTVPYDHNRVVLNEHMNANASSYINASSITDHDPRNPVYIATQGPMPSTTSDFWQLVWEQGSVVIVMLTRLNENGQIMCHRYWPEEGSDLYHIYEVHLVSEHIWCDDYLVRSFYLKNIRSGETRTVTQFHFLSWTESTTPSSTKALLEFRRKVNKSYRGRSCPIIVHCSDGAGRTGTYCLIDMVLNRMVKGSKEIDIAATLEHIRDQRPLMVKTKSQFEFVLMAVAEEVHAILKALPQ